MTSGPVGHVAVAGEIAVQEQAYHLLVLTFYKAILSLGGFSLEGFPCIHSLAGVSLGQ